MDKKNRFYKVYNSLPLKFRDEVVVVINNDAISWRLAELYIEQGTKLGEEILDKLDQLNII